MARQLYLYGGINPNNDNNVHYFFNNASLYLSALQSHLINTISLDNYRINMNVAKIALDNGINEENYDKVTYIIDYDNVSKYFRCYFVNSAVLQDFAIYNLSVDLWATYIINASFSNIHVQRCNRRLSNYGIYDNIEKVENDRHFENASVISLLDNNGIIDDTNVLMVFLLEYNVEQSAIFGDQHITETSLFCVNIGTLRGTGVNSAVEVATALVGGIFKIANDMDARVLQAWLLPSDLVELGTPHEYYEAQSKSRYGTTTFNIYLVRPSKYNVKINVPNDLNKDVIIGTYNNGIKPIRYTQSLNAKGTIDFWAFIGTNSVNVLLTQGSNQQDITSEFELKLTTNNGEVTGLRAIGSVIFKTLSNTLGTIGSIKKENYYDVARLLSSSAGSTIETKPQLSNATGNGDGGTLYYRAVNASTISSLNYPIIVTYSNSVRNEEKHARLNGALYDEYIESFEYPLTKELLGVGNDLTFDKTYIVCDAIITGIPYEAKTTIMQKLTNGIYYEYLTE